MMARTKQTARKETGGITKPSERTNQINDGSPQQNNDTRNDAPPVPINGAIAAATATAMSKTTVPPGHGGPVRSPHPHDVLSGRGGRNYNHPGNVVRV